VPRHLTSGERSGHVVLVVQNLPVPRDRRVWREALALGAAGFDVTVICPAWDQPRGRFRISGVDVQRYWLPATGGSQLGFLVETAWCTAVTALLLLRTMIRGRIDVVQVCNPPETYYVLARPLHLLRTAFVFDHHDPSPELYRSRFAHHRPILHKALLHLERRTVRAADHVIATNESLREVAVTRCGAPSSSVTVVRNGPEAARMRRGPEDARLRRGRDHLAVYVGVLAAQDGVDILLDAVHHYVRELRRDDCSFAVIGSGESEAGLREQVDRLGLSPWVELTGWLDDGPLFQYLSTASVGLCPEPPTPANLRSTMIKTTEYMAFELPVVAFDLPETRRSAGDAGVYAERNDPESFARALGRLFDDEPRRKLRGVTARRRIDEGLSWEHQAQRYVGVFEALVAGPPRSVVT
jgi:glycosyltransferase involved in cell wall biosynthesis